MYLILAGYFCRFPSVQRAVVLSGEYGVLSSQAGCAVIEIGIESSSLDELEWTGKQTTVEANERAVSLCRKHGVGVHAYMMPGFRGETLSDLENKLN